jgi:UDP-2,3-diacylglucosamine hydrolase
MSLVMISDIHVKNEKDENYEILCRFLTHPQVQKSDYIFLLGDIFDLMCGDHEQYFQKYKFFFDQLKNLLKQRKTIYYIEGNHDFHLQNFLSVLSIKKN